MSNPFSDKEIIEDMAFLFDEGIPPDLAITLHREALPNLDRLAESETLYFVIGSYTNPQKDRVEAVCEQLSEPMLDEAFMLEEIDPDIDVWENFYVKFRVFLVRCDYVIGVFEDNDGGHELEIGEADLSETYVLKRDYGDVSIENDIEYEKYDGMLGTLFNLLEERDQLSTWTTESELLVETQRLGADLGAGSPP